VKFQSKYQRGLIWVLFSAIISSLFNPLFTTRASATDLTPVISCVGLGTLQNGSFELDNSGNPGVPGSGTASTVHIGVGTTEDSNLQISMYLFDRYYS
jgi:hypothetical protein